MCMLAPVLEICIHCNVILLLSDFKARNHFQDVALLHILYANAQYPWKHYYSSGMVGQWP